MSRPQSALVQFVLGATILFIGLLWTVDNLGIADTRDALRFWPAGVIVIGLLKLFGIGTRRSLVAGLVLTVLGVAFQMDAIGAIRLTMRLFWPMVILFLGAILVVRSLGWFGGPLGAIGPGAGILAFMSGVVHKPSEELFTGGAATAVMGGVDLDLSAVRRTEEGATIDVFAFWGGVDIVVPAGWRVDNRVSALLGGIDDNRNPVASDAMGPLLTIRGLVVMGGLEIRNPKGA
jgi:hypothetical protein